MDEKELRRGSEAYERLYGGAGYYDLALDIADNYPIQASIIILATWNTGRFRYLMANNAQNLANLRNAIEECKPWFEQVKNKEFQTTDFDEIGEVVKRLYSKLASVKGIEYTGGSKVMHLLNPRLFLIWDAAMRKHYGYDGHKAIDYLKYHKQVQKDVETVKWRSSDKTLPKAIDEYHFMTITEKRKI